MNLLRKLMPDFLVQWDLRLLQNKPWLWATRVHYHLWFLLLLNALAFALGLLIGVTERRFPDPEALFGYMMVPAVAYFAFWVYRVVRFTVERRFGHRKSYAEVGEFMVHWASLLLILTLPLTLSLTVAWRIAGLTPDAEFAAEVDVLNEQAPWFYGLRQHWEYEYRDEPEEVVEVHEAYEQAAWAAEAAAIGADLKALHASAKQRASLGDGTHEFFRNFQEFRQRYKDRSESTSDVLPLHEQYVSYINRANAALDETDSLNYAPDTAAHYFAKADSIESAFPLLYTQRGAFTPSYYPTPFNADSLREEAYLARYAAKAPLDPAAIDRALRIGSKYSRWVRNIGADSVRYQFDHRLASTSDLLACKVQMDRISKAKHLHYFFAEPLVIAFGMVLPCFLLALLLGIFKATYWQPFLIAVVSAFLIPVVIIVFALITERDIIPADDEHIVMYGHWLLGAFLLATAFRIPALHAYRTNKAVMLVLANVIAPFFVLYTVGILHTEFDVFGVEALRQHISELEYANPVDPRITALNMQLGLLEEQVALIMYSVLWGGMALYVLALHPLFKRAHALLVALPERR